MELEVYKKSDFYEDYIDSQKEYYECTNADAYFAERLAEKDKEIALLKEHICNGDVSRATWIDECLAKDTEIAELKQKLEDVNDLIKTARKMLEDAKATHYAESVDAGMRERRLKRALWIARAERAKERKYKYETWERNETKKFNRDFDLIAIVSMKAKKWRRVEIKCIKKAEEYNENND